MLNFIYYNFLFGCFTQIFYWLFIFGRFSRFRVSTPISKTPHRPVSVVICAHNEADNLLSNLPFILEQKYSNFEVIVVNDRSNDGSARILSNFQAKYPHLKTITLSDNQDERNIKGKKYALSEGINTAKYEILLLTDADCKPASKQWITQMQAHLNDTQQIGLGYGPLYPQIAANAPKKNWLNRLSRLETTYTATQYYSAALLGIPYMGVGRNIVYYKSLFQKVDGFKAHSHIASGDDDLFVNQVAHKRNLSLILEPKTFMYSAPQTNWQGFHRQKTRHVSTSVYYQTKHLIFLTLFFASLIAFYIYGIILASCGLYLPLVLGLYSLKTLAMMWSSYFIFKKLQVFDLWAFLPILDFVYLLYLITLLPATINRNTTKWK